MCMYVAVVCILNNFKFILYLFFTIDVAPSNFRYTAVTFDSIAFQWNSLTGDVDWYVVRCSTGNLSFIVSIIVANIMLNKNT